MYLLDDLDFLITEAGFDPQYFRRTGGADYRSPRKRLDIGGGLQTDIATDEPEISPEGELPELQPRDEDDQYIYGIPKYKWKYMSPEQRKAYQARWERYNQLIDKSQQDWMARQPATPPTPPTPEASKKLPPGVPDKTIARVGDWWVGQGGTPQPMINRRGGPLLARPPMKLKPVGAVGKNDKGQWIDAAGNPVPQPPAPRPEAPEIEAPKPSTPEEAQYQKELTAYKLGTQHANRAIQNAFAKYYQEVAEVKAENKRRKIANKKRVEKGEEPEPLLPYPPEIPGTERGAVPKGKIPTGTAWREVTLQALKDRGYLSEIPVLPKKPVRNPRMKQAEGELADVPAINTDEGPARAVSVPQQIGQGFVIINDKYPDIPLAGPFETELEAQSHVNEVVADEIKQAVKELEDSQGEPVNDSQYFKIKHDAEDTISYRYFDPKKEEKTRIDRSRPYEYGEMRAKQLEMFQQGRDENGNIVSPEETIIKEVKDENEDPNYLERGNPTFDELKHVWCPLILDKANPPRKPWTFEQVAVAMWPKIKGIMNRWVGGGYTSGQATATALTALGKALINDRGMSPFAYYAYNWIKGDIYRDKKVNTGVIRRPSREAGWGNAGLAPLDTPLKGMEGTEEGSFGDLVGSEVVPFQKVTCPNCGGKKIEPNQKGETCEVCKGTGKTPPSKKYPEGKKCSFCKGLGQIYPPCHACGGTGRIVSVGNKEWGNLARDDKGRLIDTSTIGPKGQKMDVLTPGNLEVERSPEGDITGIHGELSPDEKAEIMERLNKANRLIIRLMNSAGLTENQKTLLALRFGLPVPGIRNGYGTPMTSTEVANMLAKATGKAAVSKQFVDTTIQKLMKKLRSTLASSKDKELFDWYEEYRKAYKLNDILDWGDQERQSRGLAPIAGFADLVDKDAADIEANDPDSPWFKKPIPPDAGPMEDEPLQWDVPTQEAPIEPEPVEPWNPKEQGTTPPLPIPRRPDLLRSRRRRKGSAFTPRTKWTPRDQIGECLDMMEALHHQLILEDIENGILGEEALELLNE